MAITEPGVYDIPEADYHADPVEGGSLSSTGARKLLPPSCPAKFRYWHEHPPERKREFDLGKAAHELVLGDGPGFEVIHAENYRSKAAQTQRDEAYEQGLIPLLEHENQQVHAMAAALRRDPAAAALFDLDRGGRPEQSLIWRDNITGIMVRARIDWLPDPTRPGRMLVGDYKTAADASPAGFARAIAGHGYHIQGAWYLDGVTALGLADQDALFLFVVQEKTPPYLVQIYELDALALKIGREQMHTARQVYADCTADGWWPGYSDQPERLSLPPYIERAYLETT